MTVLTASGDQAIAPTHVGAPRPHELQQRALRLLAHLASTWVVAQSTRPTLGSSTQENRYAVAHHILADPTDAPGAAGLGVCPPIHALPGPGADGQHGTPRGPDTTRARLRLASSTQHGHRPGSRPLGGLDGGPGWLAVAHRRGRVGPRWRCLQPRSLALGPRLQRLGPLARKLCLGRYLGHC